MKSICSILIIVFLQFTASSQNSYLDSLRQQLAGANKPDTVRVLALSAMADYYGFIQFDSSLYYASQTSSLAQNINYTYGKFLGYRSTFFALNCQGNYPRALEAAQNALKTGEQLKEERPWTVSTANYFIGVLNREMSDFPKAIEQLHKAINIQQSNGEPMSEVFFAFSQLAILYGSMNKLDSALWYAQKGYEYGLQSKEFIKFFSLAIVALGNIQLALHHVEEARDLFRMGILQSQAYHNVYFEARNYISLANLFDKTNQPDSSIFYARVSIQLCREHNFQEYLFDASRILTHVYDLQNLPDSTLKYMKIMVAAKDSVFSQSKGQQFQRYAFSEIQRLQSISAARERNLSKIKIYGLLIALIAFLFIAFILFRNSRQKQKDKVRIEKAYEELKATQSQLIQSEKMASLGELTAGIAHEIQNPLNFVNNFSEVNTELLQEMKEALSKNNAIEATELADEVIKNEEKINHHGKRADGIVKSMLQHSRASSGQKEPTDINVLADEYLRLSYHGFRAKEKAANVTLHTQFDPGIGKVSIIPQEIGRVFLNLYNNALYSISEKQKSAGPGYEPRLEVKTMRVGNKVQIIIHDNGQGIPAAVIEKIFQPFFTTKPTGKGTGLGLSLSYDIVHAHGGQLKATTKEGEYAEFMIELPLKVS